MNTWCISQSSTPRSRPLRWYRVITDTELVSTRLVPQLLVPLRTLLHENFLSSILSYVKCLFCTLTLTLAVALPDRLILWRLLFLTAASSCCLTSYDYASPSLQCPSVCSSRLRWLWRRIINTIWDVAVRGRDVSRRHGPSLCRCMRCLGFEQNT